MKYRNYITRKTTKGIKQITSEPIKQIGKVKFYMDNFGNVWQELIELPDMCLLEVTVEKTLKKIKTLENYSLEYNLNGEEGFILIKDGKIVYRNIWDMMTIQNFINSSKI